MGQLSANAIIKFTVLSSMLTLVIEPSVAADQRPNGHGQTVVDSELGGREFFRMINDFDERADAQGNPDHSGAFTFPSGRRSVVECGGVYKRLQSEIRSPAFPDGYGGNLYCEYTFKSPFVCSSQYHFQFLEFALEPSRNCSKDRVAIGEEEVLCGTVIGSKLYDAPGGVLRMKFVTDGWGTGRGFRILVTRQPCSDDDNEAAESSTEYTVFSTIQVADETEDGRLDVFTTTTEAAGGVPGDAGKVRVSSRQDIPPEFNPGGNGYLPPPTNVSPPYPPPTYPPVAFPCPVPCYPPWGCSSPNYPYVPTQPPRPGCDPRYQSCPPVYPNYPSYPQQPVPVQPPSAMCPTAPCVPRQSGVPPYPPYPQYPQYPQYPPAYFPGYPSISPGTEGTTSLGGPPPGYEPVKSEPEFAEPTTERTAPEALEPENGQVAFVPGVPLGAACCRNAFTQRRFYLSSANFPSSHTVHQDCVVQVQRYSPQTCRLVISFKFFLLGNDQLPGCPGGFIELDGRRVCGCRTGQVYRTADFGPYASKMIRVHSQAGRFPGVQGFVLDVYQEDCPQRVPLKRSDTERLLSKREQLPAAPTGPGRFSYEMGRVEGRLLPLPVQSVHSTNTTQTTTHRVYYYNLDEAQPIARPQEAPLVGRESQVLQVQYRPLVEAQKFVQPPYGSQPAGPNRCLFTTADFLRLKLDWLWIFKPVCLA